MREKDEHRTSNIERPTSNEKMKQRSEGQEQETEIRTPEEYAPVRFSGATPV